MTPLIVTLLVFVVLAIVWTILSIYIVGPKEMAVMVIFGIAWKVCDSGIHFVPWFFGLTYLARYPKKTYNLRFPTIEVLTMAGEYKGVKYGSLSALILAAEYLNFPRLNTPLGEGDDTHPLIKILRADVPIDDVKLQAWTNEAVESAVRLAFGNITWKQATEDIGEINRRVAEVFKKFDGALIKAGFRDPGIELVISKIRLPLEVEEALIKPEKTRLEADAAVKDAEAQATDRLGTVLHGMAISEGVDVSVIKARVKKNKALQAKLLEYMMGLHGDIERADRGAYFKLDSSGNPILDAVTLWKQLIGGGSPGPKSASDSSGKTPDSQRPKSTAGESMI